MNITFDIKRFLILTTVFILFTPIGTISHEYGHIAVAKIFGYDTELHYASMNYYPQGYLEDNDVKALNELTKDVETIDYESWPEELKEKATAYNDILQKRYWDDQSDQSLLVSIGGPLQTILTALIGMFLLLVRREKRNRDGLQLLDWFAIFLSLFWLRELFNLATAVGREIISPDGTWFGGDELYISQELNLWSGTLSIILATLALLVCVYVVFVIVPKKIRLTFILSGLVGGVLGFVLWIMVIGPIVLP